MLLAAEGRSTRSIAREVGVQPLAVSSRNRFADGGLEEIEERKRPGKTPIYGAAVSKRIVKLLDRSAPKGHGRWTRPLLAEALGDVDVQYVWRFLRARKIDLAGRKSWCESAIRSSRPKPPTSSALYVAPRDRAIVLCVDEKPLIQALERARLSQAAQRESHERSEPRLQTPWNQTLFAAFEVATSKVSAAQGFMDGIVPAYPSRAISRPRPRQHGHGFAGRIRSKFGLTLV